MVSDLVVVVLWTLTLVIGVAVVFVVYRWVKSVLRIIACIVGVAVMLYGVNETLKKKNNKRK